ncbi:MAG: Asp23/Gls24 family envelope stress response protein [Phascolarctobacterium sp.]|nr:Asp23/Gls24 family envelope stress response protein [Phascolarctobacterium sp.]
MGFRKKILSAVRKVQKTFNEEAGTKEQNKNLPEVEDQVTTKDENLNVVTDNTQQQDVGDIKIATEVICVVASMAALEVPGVLEMSGGLVDDVAKLMGKEKTSKGVRVDFEGKLLHLTLYLVVEFGCNIPELALNVQEHVKSQVEVMAGYEVQSVDVHIENVKKKMEKELEDTKEVEEVKNLEDTEEEKHESD